MSYANSNDYYSDEVPLWVYENATFEKCDEDFFDSKLIDGRPSRSLPYQHHPPSTSASFSRRPYIPTLGEISSLPLPTSIPFGYDQSFLLNSDPYLVVGETDRSAFWPQEEPEYSHQKPSKKMPDHSSGFSTNSQAGLPLPPNFQNNVPSRIPHGAKVRVPAPVFHSGPSTSNALAPSWQSNVPAPPVSNPQRGFGPNFVPETVEEKVSMLVRARASTSSPQVKRSVNRKRSLSIRGSEAAMEEDVDLPIAQRRVKRKAAMNHPFAKGSNKSAW